MEKQLSILLSKNKLLKNVDISKLDLNKIKGKLLTISEGQIIYREGDTADNIFLVISGEINVLKKRLLGKTKSLIFTENDFFGNEEYSEETSRVSTAIALRDSYIIMLSREEIDYLINVDNQVSENFNQPAPELEELPLEFDNPKEPVVEEMLRQTFEEVLPEENNGTGEEFFKSIADVSRIEDDNIIVKIDEDDPIVEITEENEDETALEVTFGELTPDEEIADKENGFSENIENRLKEDMPFDENVFLNEDGIPLSSVDVTQEENIDNKSFHTSELDDILFEFLAASESKTETEQQNIEEEQIVETPNIDLTDLEGESFTESSKDDNEEFELQEPIKHFDDIPTVPVENKLEIEEELSSVKSWQDFESEKIYNEADQVLQNATKNGYEEIQNISQNVPSDDEVEKMKSDKLQMIIQAAELVNSTIKIDEVLKNIVLVATGLTNADRGTLYLIDKEKDELWSLVAMGNEVKEIRLKIGEGFAGYVARTGEILNIKDVRQDTRFRSDVDKSTGYETKNTLTFPIKNNKGEIIGVLQLLNSKNGEFSKYDEELLNAMSIHAAIALNNAELVEKLLHGERVQSLGKMANFLIQDIKKPILVSKRYADHLKTKNVSPENAQIIDMLLEQLNHVADIVQTTSSYSEGKTILRTLNVSLNKTLTDFSERITTYIETRNCHINNEFEKDVTVKLDVKEFYQCYLHIIKNACDAMPDGGSITVATKRDDKEKKVKILMKDNGLGIAESLKDKIFEPFFTQGKKTGTGLGLSITKKIVEAHNGTVDVQSSLGEGTTLIITVPVVSIF